MLRWKVGSLTPTDFPQCFEALELDEWSLNQLKIRKIYANFKKIFTCTIPNVQSFSVTSQKYDVKALWESHQENEVDQEETDHVTGNNGVDLEMWLVIFVLCH